MADDPNPQAKKKPEGWNIRPFPRDLRIACQSSAASEDIYDYEWVAKQLRNALSRPPEPPVLDSAHESGQGTIRRSSEAAPKEAATKNLRNKGREKRKREGV